MPFAAARARVHALGRVPRPLYALRLFGVVAALGLLAACAQPMGAPWLINKPKTQSGQPAPQAKGAPPAKGSAAGGTQVARAEPGQASPPPPQLPSLEELLGSVPRAQDGTYSPTTAEPMYTYTPAPVPGALGMRVAVLLPLSGTNQRVGTAMLNAAQMALFDFAGPGFEMVVQDTHDSPEAAAEAARQAIANGAGLIIGPLLAPAVRAVGEVARPAGVPVMAFSSDRTVVGDGVYTMGFFPGDEVRRVMDYAHKNGARRFALLSPRGAYGDAILSAMQESAWSLGAEIASAQFYDPQAGDFSGPVKQLANYDERRRALLQQRAELEGKEDEASKLALKRLENLETLGDPPFDALLVADGGKRLVAVAALLPFYDIDPNRVKILGTGQWDDQGLGGEPALVGGWYAAPDPAQRQAFSDKYLDAFGARPHRLATLAYDATALAVVLAAQGRAAPYEQAVLAQPGGFTGRDGIFRFHADGAVERGLAVLQVERNQARVVDPSPPAFTQ